MDDTGAPAPASEDDTETAHPADETPRQGRRHPFVWGLAAIASIALVAAAVYDAGSGATGNNARNNLTIVAPADAGGGWDSAAREAQQSLREGSVVNNSQVLNIPGAGGTIGLNQLVTQMDGQNTTLMIMGITLLGAMEVNGSDVSMDEVTPIARITDDYDVVVVPADSPIETMDDLVAEWKKDPNRFAFGGGSLGSVDQMIITQLAIETGIDATDVKYIAYSGGGELATSLLSGTIKASVSGYQDFKSQIDAGELRAIAVSAPESVDYIDVPTLKDEGYDVELTNWRGIVAPPGISDAEREELIDIVTEMRETPQWKDALGRNQWEDSFETGEDFEKSLAEEQKFVDGIWKELGY